MCMWPEPRARFLMICVPRSTNPWKWSTAMKRWLRNMLFYAVLIGAWGLLAKLKVWPPYLFPTPWGVGEAMWAGFADHSFWIAIGVSMRLMLLGYGLSVALGIALGMSVASSKFLDQTLGGLLVSLQSLPSICWLPIAVLWFGLSEKAILFVVAMGSLMMGRDLNDMSQVVAVMILIVAL